MTSLKINSTKESATQNFKQIESDNWSSIYLPAICAGVVMTVVLFLAVSCSKSDKLAAQISAPAAPAVTNSALPAVAAATPRTPKKIKKHRPVNATYVNGTYGISFSYPR